MINIGYDQVAEAAAKKVNFYRTDKPAYFVSSMLAGVYVGICVITVVVMAGIFEGDFVGIKILQGISFAAALSLVVFAGAELFTGNVFVMLAGVKWGNVRKRDAVGLCAYCYLGNFVGSFLIAVLFLGTGYLQGSVLAESEKMVMLKIDPNMGELFVRGILCNILVCAAVWCVYRLKSESGKMVCIFWCIYIFVVCGFEHSIANMTLFSLKLFTENGFNALGGMGLNLLATTVGNVIGGLALSYSYWTIGRKPT
jgi:nitrite transporter NirC